jgi:type VI secretion system protein ImpK
MTESSRWTSKRAPEQELRLIDTFRELYADAVRAARVIAVPEPPDSESVRQRLLSKLSQQGAEARERLADHEMAEFEEAQYVIVAMVDEFFIYLLDWRGQDAWAARPLEAERPFNSQIAGERIFQRLDTILGGRRSVSGELLDVYLAALSLGFRGRYRFDPRSTEPERYRRELVKQMRRVAPEKLVPSPEICPAALAHMSQKERRQGLRSLREGALPLAVVIGAMLFLAHTLWYYRTLEVREQLDRIEEERERLNAEEQRREPRKPPETPGGAR